MQHIPSTFNWFEHPTIAWPDSDTKLLQVIDQVHDLNQVNQYVNNWSSAIQAGGACGLWPIFLSLAFDQVHTFEPVNANYLAMLENIRNTGRTNITAYPSALGEAAGSGGMRRDDFEKGNAGAWYLSTESLLHTISVATIDSLNLTSVGLIQLDIEGHELFALKGAADTIKRCRPTIVIEEKPLPHMQVPQWAAREYLQRLGYTERATVHRDVIFTC
jgi:FkbM family methyltransferase